MLSIDSLEGPIESWTIRTNRTLNSVDSGRGPVASANYHGRMSGLFDGTPLERPVTCERCGLPRKQCKCPRGADGQVLMPKNQPARVSRERRGGGKLFTIIPGLDHKATDLAAMLKQFKAQFRAGGTIADGRIELQGDHRDKLVEILRDLGIRRSQLVREPCAECWARRTVNAMAGISLPLAELADRLTAEGPRPQ